jgi:DNA-binding beta-propeller fold protein YncE
VLEFGGLGTGEGKFNTPSGLAVDHEGRIIVGDGGNGLIQVFNSKGDFEFQFGEPGDGDGQFNGFHISVAALEGGRIAAVDQETQRVQLFDAKGQFERSFGTEGTDPGQFRMPATVNTDRDGRHIVVTDPGNDRVQIFDLNGDLQQPPVQVMAMTCGDALLDPGEEVMFVSLPANDRIPVYNVAAMR